MDALSLRTFVALERRVWEALRTGDADADARLLSEDFLGVYPGGFAGRDDHAGQLSDGPSVAAYDLSGETLTILSDDAALLTYAARFTRPGAPGEERMFVTSLWRRRDSEWLNIFSQDTPAKS